MYGLDVRNVEISLQCVNKGDLLVCFSLIFEHSLLFNIISLMSGDDCYMNCGPYFCGG